MTEENLKMHSLSELCDFMVITIDEYLKLEKFHENKEELKIRRTQLHLLHKVITEKRAEKKR
jgi:hypothetical protein